VHIHKNAVVLVEGGHLLAILELGGGHVASHHVVSQNLIEQRDVLQQLGQDARREALKKVEGEVCVGGWVERGRGREGKRSRGVAVGMLTSNA
jgi:hypothetical protein